MKTTRRTPSRPVPRGFTLAELLIVTLIVLLLTVATLPVVLPALNERRISSAANLLQAALAGARDAAIRNNEVRGIRLLPDPPNGSTPNTLTSSRFIPLEVPDDYTEGFVNQLPPASALASFRLGVIESKTAPNTTPTLPNPPTSWFFNIRQGDKLQVGTSGITYTVAGPMQVYTSATANGSGPFGVQPGPNTTIVNPERFISILVDANGPTFSGINGVPAYGWSSPINANAEFLYLVDGRDNDGDGFVDEAFDGLDNDGDGIIDPGFNGLDDDGDGLVDDPSEMLLHKNANGQFTKTAGSNNNEFEQETLVLAMGTNANYTITRRPVPAKGAREVELPNNVVVDLTTLVANTIAGNPSGSERSRLPIDPFTGFVDILIAPNGQIIQSTPASGSVPPFDLPFFHFWICERDEVFAPISINGVAYTLPMPVGTPNYPAAADTSNRFLKLDRRMITLNPKTGQVTTNAISQFDGAFNLTTNPPHLGINTPFIDAQLGVKEQP
jgi:prepilin-type N-terminal cleavage/methylation domain-containing protein